MEYPAYGVYNTTDVTKDKHIKEDTLILYDYLVKHVGLNPQDIVVFGRSIGSGPATYLASKREVNILYLMSAYTCIKDVAR